MIGAAEPPCLSAERVAMNKLHWGARELYLASFAYGNVGDENDVRLHLVTGDHLGPAGRSVLTAALNDALIDRGDPFRVADQGADVRPAPGDEA